MLLLVLDDLPVDEAKENIANTEDDLSRQWV
jgi:hypothetical protein